ncbi:hypothetical protein V9T40_002742 [Parthenolecanium corni]|uniref:Uncharacterized protein n=1 Tax=Parthenolecanium corni TaxID=536013 RepID=A0AAN9TIZ1_9HEMI
MNDISNESHAFLSVASDRDNDRRLNFRPAVSFIGQLSQFSPRCRNFLPDVTIFGWMSQSSAGCLIFPAVEN